MAWVLCDLLPSSVVSDPMDNGCRHAKLQPNAPQAHAIVQAIADLAHYIGGKFRCMVIGAAFGIRIGGGRHWLGFGRRVVLPALIDHVVGVVLRRAKKQVSRIAARRVIARVEHPQSIRDFADVHLVREAMRHDDHGAVEEVAITVTALRPVPLPATVRLLRHLGNEALLRRDDTSSIPACRRAEALLPIRTWLCKRRIAVPAIVDGGIFGSRHLRASLQAMGGRHRRERVQPLPGLLTSKLYRNSATFWHFVVSL